MKSLIISVMLSLVTVSTVFAENIVIGINTKVFETPIAKDEYAAVNQNDVPVILVVGMAFPVIEKNAGWYVIEYTSGLRGHVMQNVLADATAVKAPAPGTYNVSNNPKESVRISKSGDEWMLISGSNTFSGKADGHAVIFMDKDGHQVYSLCILSGKPMVYTYDNAVTKFF